MKEAIHRDKDAQLVYSEREDLEEHIEEIEDENEWLMEKLEDLNEKY